MLAEEGGKDRAEVPGVVSDAVDERRLRLRRRLWQVSLCDASSCAALIAVALRTRSRSSGPVYAAIARTAVTGFLPGAAAVLRECRAHREADVRPHRMSPTVALILAGSVINSMGTFRVLISEAPRQPLSRPALAVDVALLIAGNAIGVPYSLLIRALHRDC